MRRLITAYDAASAPAGALRDSLEDRMGLIFERCTMEGEAHLALHDYLLPFIAQFKELEDHPTPAQLDSLANYLRTFDQKFQ